MTKGRINFLLDMLALVLLDAEFAFAVLGAFLAFWMAAAHWNFIPARMFLAASVAFIAFIAVVYGFAVWRLWRIAKKFVRPIERSDTPLPEAGHQQKEELKYVRNDDDWFW